ncbi:hypothetical protein PBCVCZ2_144R [Paramecium bursaria Chlorella virus CZ-2]|nr:hypothetical protein PBCVCZ2_144R [Paramecium bursaria Chlorella virus CZ-2]
MPLFCNHSECKKYASYNVVGLKARWCKAHKKPEMVDVANKKCPCGKRPYFNLPGETMGICCKECKTSEMVNVMSKLCLCGKQPSFNFPGKIKGIYCKECKTPGMINVISKLCSCGKHPIFNFPGEIKGICCTECKTSGMFDVINKKCPCGNGPSFNLPGETVGICCKECKTPGMVNVKHKKCPCGNRPSFNLPEETMGICCKECKTPEMVNVISKRCPGYNGEKCPGNYHLASACQYCLSCDPDDSRRETRKKYENAFFKHIAGRIDVKRREFIVKYDTNETAKKFARLDGIVFGDGITVCLEVDENGHERYACDESRMHMVTAELLKEYPHTDVCWIRVNPTTKHKNPWGVAAKRVRAERFDAVIKVVDDVLKNKTTDIIYIGFDV